MTNGYSTAGYGGSLSREGFRRTQTPKRPPLTFKQIAATTVLIGVLAGGGIGGGIVAKDAIVNGVRNYKQNAEERKEQRLEAEQAAAAQAESERMAQIPQYAQQAGLTYDECIPFFLSGQQSYESQLARGMNTIPQDRAIQRFFGEYAEVVKKARAENPDAAERLAAAQMLSLIALASRLPEEHGPVYSIFVDLFDSQRGVRKYLAPERRSSTSAMIGELLNQEQRWYISNIDGRYTYYRELMQQVVSQLNFVDRGNYRGWTGVTAVDPNTNKAWWTFDKTEWIEGNASSDMQVKVANGMTVRVSDTGSVHYVTLRLDDGCTYDCHFVIYGLSKQTGDVVQMIDPTEVISPR